MNEHLLKNFLKHIAEKLSIPPSSDQQVRDQLNQKIINCNLGPMWISVLIKNATTGLTVDHCVSLMEKFFDEKAFVSKFCELLSAKSLDLKDIFGRLIEDAGNKSFAEAKAIYSSIERYEPLDNFAILPLLESVKSNDHLQEAVEEIRNLIKDQGVKPNRRVIHALLLKNKKYGQLHQIEDMIDQAIRNRVLSLESFESILQQYQEKKEYEQLIARYDSILQINPLFLTASLYNKFQEAIAEKEDEASYKKVINIFKDALAADKLSIQLVNRTIHFAGHRKEFSLVKEAFDRATSDHHIHLDKPTTYNKSTFTRFIKASKFNDQPYKIADDAFKLAESLNMVERVTVNRIIDFAMLTGNEARAKEIFNDHFQIIFRNDKDLIEKNARQKFLEEIDLEENIREGIKSEVDLHHHNYYTALWTLRWLYEKGAEGKYRIVVGQGKHSIVNDNNAQSDEISVVRQAFNQFRKENAITAKVPQHNPGAYIITISRLSLEDKLEPNSKSASGKNATFKGQGKIRFNLFDALNKSSDSHASSKRNSASDSASAAHSSDEEEKNNDLGMN